jgi:hypothetical protein
MSQPYDPNQPPGGYPPPGNYPQYPDPNQPQYPTPSQQPYPPQYPQPSQQPQAYPQQPTYPSQPYQQPYQQPTPSQQPQYPTPSQQPQYPTPSQQPYPGYTPTSPQYPGQTYGAPNYGDVPPSQPLLQQPYGVQPDGWPTPNVVAPYSPLPPEPKSLPGWLWMALLGVGIVGTIGLFFTGSNAGILDWSQGALHGGIFAAVVGLVALIMAAIQIAGKKNALGLGLVGVILLGLGGAAVGLPGPIRSAQVGNLEGQDQYQNAVNLLVADKASDEDIAAVYDTWGEHLTSAAQYTQAVTEFDTVIHMYAGATNGVARANKDEATAYFDLAEADLTTAATSGDYTSAVGAFSKIQTTFLSATDAAKVHADYAKALFGLGNQELKLNSQSGCTSAVTAYTQLANSFSDTPEGQQAKTALAQPVSVSGKFSGTVKAAPSGDANVVFLLPNADPNYQGQVQAGAVQSNGTFAIAKVMPGTYGLVWGYVNISANQITQITGYLADSAGNLLAFQVTQLCSVSLTVPGNFSKAYFSSRAALMLHSLHVVFDLDTPTPMLLVRELFTILGH